MSFKKLKSTYIIRVDPQFCAMFKYEATLNGFRSMRDFSDHLARDAQSKNKRLIEYFRR